MHRLLPGTDLRGEPLDHVLASAGAATVDPSSVEYFRVSVGDTVYFPTDQTDLSGQAQAVLDRQAAWLMQNPSVRVRIEGHADERGTREYNLALGARRANAVQSYLASKGVERGRIEAVTYGRERPIETTYQASAELSDEERVIFLGTRGRARIHVGYQTLASRTWRYLSRTFRFDL